MKIIDGRPYLFGHGNYPWQAEILGDDLVIRNVRVTCFGGNTDFGDDGFTASGVLTRNNLFCRGCALPTGRCAATLGSPLPRLRWQTPIIFTHGTKSITCPLIDEGPADKAHGGALGAAGDLTRQSMLDLGGIPGDHMDGDLLGVTITIKNYKQHLE